MRGKLGTQGGQLDVQVLIREVEIRAEGFNRDPMLIPFQREGAGLIYPCDAVEIEDRSEGFFSRV
jgi:hypothetical protein